MQNNLKIPDWLKQEPKIVKINQNSKFLSHNLGTLSHILAHFNQPIIIHHGSRSAWAELVNLFLLVVITITGQNYFLLWLLAIVFLFNLLMMPAVHLLAYINSLAQISVVSIIITLPSVLLTSPKVAALWLFKIILVIGEVQIFRHRTTWAELITALRQLRVPGLFILTLDITIKYSHVLGHHLQASLQAIQLRCCGVPRKPLKLTGQILGLLYLASQEEAKQLYDAMLLRGYRENFGKIAWQSHWQDWQLIGLDITMILFTILN